MQLKSRKSKPSIRKDGTLGKTWITSYASKNNKRTRTNVSTKWEDGTRTAGVMKTRNRNGSTTWNYGQTVGKTGSKMNRKYKFKRTQM